MVDNNPKVSELVLIDALRELVPVNVLPSDTFDTFAEHIQVETATSGTELFHYGDSNNQVTYLLSGEVFLKDRNNKLLQTIRGGTERARYPLAHELPREVTAKARTNVAYVQINMQELNNLMSTEYSLDHQIGDIRVRDIQDVEDDDWVTFALKSFIFENIPPANLQLILNHFITLPVKKGDIILNQGEIANYYYYIRQGRCEVTKKYTVNESPKVIAELKQGDAFGEDALIAKTKRNASITMLTDGILMRLSSTDFKELIERPLLKPLAPIEMEQHIAQGAQILDVREPADYELTHLAKSRNIPYRNFREAISSLDPTSSYITYSNNGRRSAVTAFLLMQRGIDAFYLNERRQQPKYTLADTVPTQEPEKDIKELDKLKDAYKMLQQQLKKELQLRKLAENKIIECQDEAKESLNAAEVKMARLNEEKINLQATSDSSEHLADDIKELKAEKEDIQRQLESYYSRIQNEADHLDNEVKAIQDLEATRITALKEIEQLHADTTRSKREAEEAHRLAEQKEQRLISEAAKLADLNDSRIKEEKKLAELEARKVELEKIVDKKGDIQNELDTLLIQLASTREDMNAVHQQIHTETEQLSKLKNQKLQQESILKNNVALEQKLEKLNNQAKQAQSKTEQAQEKLKQQQALLNDMESKKEEYILLSESQKKMQAELKTLTTQLEATRQKIELTSQDTETHKLESQLNTLQAKEEAAKIKAEAEEVYLKAEQQAIQIKAEADQARLQAQKEIAKAKVKAEQIQLHAEAEAARIKSEVVSLQKQTEKSGTKNEL